MPKKMKLIIDVADTLFPQSSGIRERFNARVMEAAKRFETVFRENNIIPSVSKEGRIENLPQIIRALKAKNSLAHKFFLDFCYDPAYLGLDSIERNQQLVKQLERFGFDNIGFYSSDTLPHVRTILTRLGITKSMIKDDQIIDVYRGGDLPKPSREGLLKACEKLGFEPTETVVIDDWQNVLSTAEAAGALVTVWINEKGEAPQRGLRKPDVIAATINAGLDALLSSTGSAPTPQTTPDPQPDVPPNSRRLKRAAPRHTDFAAA